MSLRPRLRPPPSKGGGVDSTFSGQGKLVVEVDGGYTGTGPRRTRLVTWTLAYYGIRVVRIDAWLVVRDLSAALRLLRGHIG